MEGNPKNPSKLLRLLAIGKSLWLQPEPPPHGEILTPLCALGAEEFQFIGTT